MIEASFYSIFTTNATTAKSQTLTIGSTLFLENLDIKRRYDYEDEPIFAHLKKGIVAREKRLTEHSKILPSVKIFKDIVV